MQVYEKNEIVLKLDDPSELFDGPVPGRESASESSTPSWDDVGAALGESAVTRMLRSLQAQPHATQLTLSVRMKASVEDHEFVGIEDRLRRWCQARIAASREEDAIHRRIGFRILGLCTLLLAVTLVIAWAIQLQDLFGPVGPLRTLIAEAMTIAGWVVMWRPLEMLFFDRMRSTMERRLLERALSISIRVEKS